MKKFNYLLNLLAFAALTTLFSCGDDTVDPLPPTNTCSTTSTFPSTSGTAIVAFKNFPGTAAIVPINASAGDVLSIAVDIQKGTNRPQKLKVYQTGCDNELGTVVDFTGQPETEDAGKTIDLRNTDNQVRTVLYTVPTGVSPLYLNFEINESGGTLTYKRLKITVSGSGVIDSFTGITLGAQSNALPSRASSSTGYVYLACETAANINTIDLTYAIGNPDGKPYISSNPARFLAPVGLTVTTRDCGTEEGTINTNGGNPTYFATATSANFDAATDATLGALSVTTSNPQYIEVQNGGVYSFMSNNRKGLFRVTSLTAGATGTITIDVKVQR